MKNFVKTLFITLLSLYAFASFVAWDITTIIEWNPFGRGVFIVVALFISAIYDSIKNESK